MNPFSFITRPVHDLASAVWMPFKALFVVGLCVLINAITSPHHWWVQWVALGMGIAVLVTWARAIRTLLVLGLVAWVARWVHRKYGAAAGQQFDAWAQRHQPQAANGVSALRRGNGA
jgi:hypothetical protein